MLLFEFVGELFQFDAREPEFAALFQFPPKIDAASTLSPSTPDFHRLHPGAEHFSHFCQMHLGDPVLVGRNDLA